MNSFPKFISDGLLSVIKDIPAEVGSDRWRALCLATAMILSPKSFKKGVHVYIHGHDSAHEEGAFNEESVSIKIWPHKIQLRHQRKEWTSWNGYSVNFCKRFSYPDKQYKELCKIYPDNNYYEVNFEEIMSGISCFCFSEDSTDDSDYQGACYTYSNFDVETNV